MKTIIGQIYRSQLGGYYSIIKILEQVRLEYIGNGFLKAIKEMIRDCKICKKAKSE